MTETLPNGWTTTKIGEILQVRSGDGLTKKQMADDGTVPVYGGNGVTGYHDNWNISEETIVIGRVGYYCGSVHLTPNRAWVTDNAFITRYSESNIDKKFLYYLLNSTDLRLNDSSTAQPVISGKKIYPIEVLLPPLPEQNRIAVKLECLLAKVDACKARLDKVPEIIKRFRQSVLADAVSGKLTEDWRNETNAAGYADELLIKTNEYREIYYNKAVLKAKMCGKKKPRPFKLNEEIINIDELPDIPQGWVWERLVNISNIQGGVTKGRKLNGKQTIKLPYLRVANVQDGFLDLKEIKNIDILPEDKDKYKLLPGDILFTEGGDRDKLGRGTVWKGEIDNCIHQNHIFRARLYCPNILSDYASIATKSDTARKYFFDNANQTVNLASINMTTLGKVPIALPPEKEQIEIVRRVGALFFVADQLEDKLRAATLRIEKLTSSILSQAFRGELVPQNPNDEPAEMLLKRIRAEWEAMAASKKKGRRTLKKRSGRGKRTPPQKAEAEAEPEPVTPKPAKESSAKATAATVKPRKQPPKSIEKRFEKAELLKAFRKAAFRRNGLTEDSLLRLVGHRLGVRRLSQPIRCELQITIPTALRRNIIARNGTGYYGATPTIQHYDDTELIKVLRSVIRKGYEYEREHITAEAAAYLGFDKVSDAFAEKMKTIFRLAIRRGQLYRNGKYVGKT